ncbi:Uncharacterised protein [uncultured archaeon]|nr:Uncharacterised protein [uncultured archaeon]
MDTDKKNPLKVKKILEANEAVAEVLDFVTLVGILLLSFSLIGLVGYPALRSNQEARYIENTRLSFTVLANNLNKVANGQAPSQSMELKMYGGRLSVRGDSTINITANNSAGQRVTILPTQQMRTIENSIDDNVVAYEGTGVWVKYPNGVILTAYKPLVTNQSNVLVMPVVTITGISSSSGTGLSRITAKGLQSFDFQSNMSNIIVTINSSYIDGWKSFYNGTLSFDWNNCTASQCSAQLNKSNIDVYLIKTIMYTEVN